MDDVFRRNSAKRVAEYFVVVGFNFEGLLELREINSEQQTAGPAGSSSSPTSTPSKTHEFEFYGGYVDILSTSFEASQLHRYPDADQHQHQAESNASPNETDKFPEGIEFFCFPKGLMLTEEPSNARFHAFIHTSEHGSRMVGCCLTFDEELTETQYAIVNTVYAHMASLKSTSSAAVIADLLDFGEDTKTEKQTESVSCQFGPHGTRLFVAKALCILSYWPFVDAFKKYLTILYGMIGPDKSNAIPMERYICNFIDDIPAPPAGKIDVIYYINDEFISFKCPPLNVPSTWMGFPLTPLFECLNLHNILILFVAILTERQILLISSQYSLLTSSAEGIVSLLYPLSWAHAYIPILPSRLLGVLGAPFPFLLGLHSSLYEENTSSVGGETVKVFLDLDIIDIPQAYPLPALPDTRRAKLVAALEAHVPWYAPALTASMEGRKRLFETFRERIRAADEVPGLGAHEGAGTGSRDRGNSTGSTGSSKSSPAVPYNPLAAYITINKVHNSYFPSLTALRPKAVEEPAPVLGSVQEVPVREAFLKFFLAMLKDYKRHLVYNTAADPQQKFRFREFIAEQPPTWHPLLEELANAQCFSQFIDERLVLSKLNRDVIFFDEAIDAKMNRYRLRRASGAPHLDTPFLLHRAEDGERSYVPPSPCTTSLNGPWVYDRFPALDRSLLVAPRNLAAQFAPLSDQLMGLLSRLRLKRKSAPLDGNAAKTVNPAALTALSASCSCYIVLLCAVISSSLGALDGAAAAHSGYLKSTRYMLETYSEGSAAIGGTSVGPGRGRGSSISIGNGSEQRGMIRRMSISTADPLLPMPIPMSLPIATTPTAASSSSSVHTSCGVALQVAYEVLDRLLGASAAGPCHYPDELVYRCLAEACGDLGEADRLLDLFALMDTQGVALDHQLRHALVRALINQHLLGGASTTRMTPSEVWTYTSWGVLRRDASASTLHIPISSEAGMLRVLFLESPLPAARKALDPTISRDAWSSNPAEGNVPNLQWHLSLPPTPSSSSVPAASPRLHRLMRHSEACLLAAYPCLSVDLASPYMACGNPACPMATKVMSIGEVYRGWTHSGGSPTSSTYTTSCLHCSTPFIPRFSVSTSATQMQWLELLSPWVLYKEACHLLYEGGGGAPQGVVYWNLLVAFRLRGLPAAFLTPPRGCTGSASIVHSFPPAPPSGKGTTPKGSTPKGGKTSKSNSNSRHPSPAPALAVVPPR